MGCCGSKAANAKAPQAPQVPSQQAKAAASIQSQAAFQVFFKPISNERKMLYYNTRDKVAFELSVSTPFRFKPYCGVVMSPKGNRMYFVGGFTGGELFTAQSDDFSDECMILELTSLTGKRILYPSRVGYMTLLVHHRGEEEDVYSVGGCQVSAANDDTLEQGTFAMLNSSLPQWESLPAMRSQKYCWPVAVLLNSNIYCAGGFVPVNETFEAKDSIMMYRIQTRAWTQVQFKFSPIFACLAAQLNQTEYLIFNMQQKNGKAPTLTLSETKLLNSPLPDCPEKEFWYPVYQSPASFSIISEDFWLYTFDKVSTAWSGLNMREAMRPVDFSRLPGVVPRTPKLFAFHVDLDESCITEFNTMSNLVTESKYRVKFCKNAGICVVPDTGEILLLGGKEQAIGQLSKNCIAVGPGTGNVRTLAPLPEPQQGIRVVLVLKQLFAMAGFNDRACFCQMLDPATQNWAPLPSPPTPLEFPVCFELKKTIYMIGGQKISEAYDLSNEVYAMSLEEKTWAKLKIVYPIEVYHSSAVAIPKRDAVLIFGGDGAKEEQAKSCFQFDGQQFRPAPNLEAEEEAIFEDPPCTCGDDVFIYTRAGQCFRLNLETLTWNDVEGDEVSEAPELNRV